MQFRNPMPKLHKNEDTEFTEKSGEGNRRNYRLY